MNFRAKDELGTNVALIVAFILILGSLVVSFAVPKPTKAGVLAKQKAQIVQIQVQADDAHKAYAASQAKVAAQTWTGSEEQIGPGALQAMNALAAKHKVKLSGFRPERTLQASGLDLIPFSVTAEGSYMDLVNFVKDIENPDNKVCVNTVQIASSEANGDQVTATVGITAYRVSKGVKNG